MIKKIAWEAFKNTGDINMYLELKQIENLEDRIEKNGLNMENAKLQQKFVNQGSEHIQQNFVTQDSEHIQQKFVNQDNEHMQ